MTDRAEKIENLSFRILELTPNQKHYFIGWLFGKMLLDSSVSDEQFDSNCELWEDALNGATTYAT